MTTTTRKFYFQDPAYIRAMKAPDLNRALNEGLAARNSFKLRSAYKTQQAGKGALAIAIDVEGDFTEKGRLPVNGMFDDVGRMIDRLIDRTLASELSGLIATLDGHPPLNIHSPNWWENVERKWPDPSIPLMMELVDPSAKLPFRALYPDGKEVLVGGKPVLYRPRYESDWTTKKYAPHLKATGQGNIWVFNPHCHLGTDGANLVPAFAEAVTFIAAALELQPQYMFKGHIAKVDWFGPFRPCMDVLDHAQGGLQTSYLDEIPKHAVTEFFGEAEDFCVRNGMRQVLEYYGAKRSILERIRFLGNCTSAIVPDNKSAGFTPNADFRDQMVSQGVQVISHDSPL